MRLLRDCQNLLHSSRNPLSPPFRVKILGGKLTTHYIHFLIFFSFISLPLLLSDYSDSYYPVLIFPEMFNIVNHFVFTWNPFLSLRVASVFASFFWVSVLKPAHPSLALSPYFPSSIVLYRNLFWTTFLKIYILIYRQMIASWYKVKLHRRQIS